METSVPAEMDERFLQLFASHVAERYVDLEIEIRGDLLFQVDLLWTLAEESSHIESQLRSWDADWISWPVGILVERRDAIVEAV